MHASWEDIPITLQTDDSESRLADWGDMTVAFQRLPAGLGSASLFQELPGGKCPSAHWGFVLKGRMRFLADDGEEIIEAGQAYYIAPGHTGEFLEETEVVEFSPTKEFRMTIDLAAQKMLGKKK